MGDEEQGVEFRIVTLESRRRHQRRHRQARRQAQRELLLAELEHLRRRIEAINRRLKEMNDGSR